MNDSLIRRLATLTSVKRTRIEDAERQERDGTERDQRVAEAVSRLEVNVEELKAELKLSAERREWRKAA